MTYTVSDPTVKPKQVMETFRRAYQTVHHREPLITHMFDDWYSVNGETVHRLTLFGEITRLRELAQKNNLLTSDKTVIQRLISRLRNL
ncbi:MAG TPA: hypothetical protein VHO69_04435 [Phototrophicaceae bacterium]|nr:hypothetical protein [Phototrophicaceae bacterium]